MMNPRFSIGLVFFFLVISPVLPSSDAQVEFGIGFTTGIDFFQRQVNPGTDISNERRSSGNVLLNPTLGPKLWLGNSVFSFSLEGQVNWGMTSLDVNEYKGMGAVSFPVMGAFNFEGLSGLEALGVFGVSVGGGVQFSRTELYLHPEEHNSVHRSFFPVYFGQINLGVGYNGMANYLYLRLAYGREDSHALHIGIMTDINLRRTKADFSTLKNLF